MEQRAAEAPERVHVAIWVDGPAVAYIRVDIHDRLREQAEGLRSALKNIDSIASRGDVNVQPLLDPIRRVARETLARYRGGDDGE